MASVWTAFYRAAAVFFRSSCSCRDLRWARHYLNHEQRMLFRAMLPCDQAHSVRTACKVQELAPIYGIPEEDMGLLVRAALLHDIGKGGAELGLTVRVLQHLPLSTQLKQRISGTWPNGFYGLQVLQDHPAIGGVRLREISAPDPLIRLVIEHHCPKTILGEVLKRADDC